MKTYYHLLTDPQAGPVGPPKDRALISSVRVEEGPGHDMIHVWNRGGKSGLLVVGRGDGEAIAALLLPLAERRAAAS